MDNSKLITLLKTFNSKELREFKDFLASPYFNKNEELSTLYNYLKKLAPAFPIAKIKREVVFLKTFPNELYDEKKLNYLMSFMLKSAEEYLSIKNYQEKSHLVDYHTLECLIDRNLDKHYSNVYKKAIKRLNENPYRDTDFHHQQFLLGDISNQYFNKKKVRKSNHGLQDASDYFDQYYLVKKLRYTCEMIDREQILSTQFNRELIDEVDQYLKKNPMDHAPAISIYYRIYLSLVSEDYNTHFQKLKTLIGLHFHQFPPAEIGLIMHLSINFCVRKIRHQEEAYISEALDLYTKGIESKVLLVNGVLSPWTFKNTVKLGLRSERYQWTENFIYNYNKLLEPKFRQNALHYNLAELFYYKKDYEAAQKNLSMVEFDDIFYALHSKVMLVKIYFENREEEPLLALIASFKLFIKRNKVVSENMREAYLNFIQALGQLAKKDKSRIPEIKQFITDTKVFTDRNWLLEMIKREETAISR